MPFILTTQLQMKLSRYTTELEFCQNRLLRFVNDQLTSIQK